MRFSSRSGPAPSSKVEARVTTRVGGEVDSFCGKCKMLLAHIVLAMVGKTIARVRCNTCGTDHAFRRVPGTSTPASVRSPARGARTAVGFAAQIEARGEANARAYSPQATFQVDELIAHPTFGLGIVRAVRRDKVDVAFKTTERVLIHGRAGAGPATESEPATT
jgi:hypothetical protein